MLVYWYSMLVIRIRWNGELSHPENSLDIWWTRSFRPNLVLIHLSVFSEKTGFTDDGRTNDRHTRDYSSAAVQ